MNLRGDLSQGRDDENNDDDADHSPQDKTA